jgi:hypothetical protein
MRLDVRWPLGAFFTLLGALLAIYGAVAGDAVHPLGINVNLWWGLVLALFGIVMLLLAAHSRRSSSSS